MMAGEKVSKLGRLRRKVLGLVALGFRPKQYRAKFEWIFGAPTARQVKRGLSWSIRTPSRLVRLGLKPEHHLGDLEADVRIGEISKSEFVELFFRMMEKWIIEKEKEGFEAVWIKVLPHSGIAKLVRGRGGGKSDKSPSVTTLPLLAKDSLGLWNVLIKLGRRSAHLKLTPIKSTSGKHATKKIVLPAAISRLKMPALLENVKGVLNKHGFKPLIYIVPRERKTRKATTWRWNTPWDYIIYAPGLMLVSTEEDVRRGLMPKLIDADPKYRGYILECMIEMWRKIHPRYVFGRMVDEVKFEELRKWFMPHDRCDNIDAFKDSLESIRRCFGLELWEMGRLYGKAVRWWLHHDALAYLKKLLTKKKG